MHMRRWRSRISSWPLVTFMLMRYWCLGMAGSVVTIPMLLQIVKCITYISDVYKEDKVQVQVVHSSLFLHDYRYLLWKINCASIKTVSWIIAVGAYFHTHNMGVHGRIVFMLGNSKIWNIFKNMSLRQRRAYCTYSSTTRSNYLQNRLTSERTRRIATTRCWNRNP
jgi:hypothetical protein